MSVRHSEYARQERDFYQTPQWCWESLRAVEPWTAAAFDCAPIDADFDFLSMTSLPAPDVCSNPPYGGLAEKFARHAVDLTAGHGGRVALLLPTNWDCAKGRVDLLGNPPFARKWIMTRRIRWVNLPQKTAGPSMNHAVFVWDWHHAGPANLGWLT